VVKCIPKLLKPKFFLINFAIVIKDSNKYNFLLLQVKKMWAIENGLCIEREAGNKDTEFEKG